MKPKTVQLVVSLATATLVFWLHKRSDRDPNIDPDQLALKRQWVVVGMLLMGGLFVLKSKESNEQGKRRLKVVGWVFLIVGVILGLRLTGLLPF